MKIAFFIFSAVVAFNASAFGPSKPAVPAAAVVAPVAAPIPAVPAPVVAKPVQPEEPQAPAPVAAQVQVEKLPAAKPVTVRPVTARTKQAKKSAPTPAPVPVRVQEQPIAVATDSVRFLAGLAAAFNPKSEAAK